MGYLKGLGKVYLHTVVDAYCSFAFDFLHTSKQAEAAAALLHNDVLPFYRQYGLRVKVVLTDNGREFCGKDDHPYKLYLELNDIEHRYTQSLSRACRGMRHPQTNGFVGRFQRTILEEFYQVAFRKKIYHTIEELQVDLDQWLWQYNHERTHSGKYCFGRTPYQTFQETKHLAQEKMLDTLFPKEVDETVNVLDLDRTLVESNV